MIIVQNYFPTLPFGLSVRCAMEHGVTFAQLGENISSAVELADAGEWSEAEDLQRKAIIEAEELLGKSQKNLIPKLRRKFDESILPRCANLLASVLTPKGRWQQAETLLRELCRLAEVRLPPGHCDTLSMKHDLAGTFKNQGKWAESEEIYREVLEVRCRVLGPEHSETLSSKNSLANALQINANGRKRRKCIENF